MDRSHQTNSQFERYYVFSSSGNLDSIPVDSLDSVCFALDVEGEKYLVEPLNPYELE